MVFSLDKKTFWFAPILVTNHLAVLARQDHTQPTDLVEWIPLVNFLPAVRSKRKRFSLRKNSDPLKVKVGQHNGICLLYSSLLWCIYIIVLYSVHCLRVFFLSPMHHHICTSDQLIYICTMQCTCVYSVYILE